MTETVTDLEEPEAHPKLACWFHRGLTAMKRVMKQGHSSARIAKEAKSVHGLN